MSPKGGCDSNSGWVTPWEVFTRATKIKAVSYNLAKRTILLVKRGGVLQNDWYQRHSCAVRDVGQTSSRAMSPGGCLEDTLGRSYTPERLAGQTSSRTMSPKGGCDNNPGWVTPWEVFTRATKIKAVSYNLAKRTILLVKRGGVLQIGIRDIRYSKLDMTAPSPPHVIVLDDEEPIAPAFQDHEEDPEEDPVEDTDEDPEEDPEEDDPEEDP
ncbi:hypothetical protein E3N88_40412 [Mikania micrantha]|uniref:Uncharacterized protein n=1 Tax=Mikania micrantha TaxID=192012 RepID=A0A5N6LMN6_9ASTR|nr:hypothetical protein E3N88_40412 [Mikania micrantha]